MNREERVILSLGSNLGQSSRILTTAVESIREFSRTPLKVSSLWATAPIGCSPGAPDFLNICLAMDPFDRETPFSLLENLRSIEEALGRTTRHIRNESRTLDIDIILFGDRVIQSTELTIPHPRATERLFVIEPLLEIITNPVFPGLTIDWKARVKELSQTQKVTRLVGNP